MQNGITEYSTALELRNLSKLPPNPRVKLSILRDIGWEKWDPIGLLPMVGEGSKWDHPDNLHFANEYDTYLVSAASQLRRGASVETVVKYLGDIEANYMGLGVNPTTFSRARSVVKAIQNASDLWTWPDESGKFG